MLQEAPTLLRLHEGQSSLDGNHGSRTANIPEKHLWFSSLEK